MVELRETFADVTNIRPQGRADINRPSATPPGPGVAQAASQAEQSTIAAILATPKNYTPKELLTGSNAVIAAKLRSFATKQEMMAAEQRRLGSFGKSGFASDATQKARNLRKLAASYDRGNVRVNMASAERLIKELHPGGIQAERRENLAAKALGLRKPNPRARTGPIAEGPEVYEVTDAAGKKWRSSNKDFLERKTGVDVNKVTPGTIVLRDAKTGQVYYGREQTIRGKKKVLAVGKPLPRNARTTTVSVQSTRERVPTTSQTSQEFFQEGRLKGLTEQTGPPALGVGDFGGNITQLPPGTEPGFRGDFFLPKIDVRTGKQFGTLTAGPEKRRFGSEVRSDIASVAAAKGDFREEALQRGLAFTTGVFEAGRALVTDPIGFFVDPIAKPRETLKAAQEQLQVNPTGLFGQLAVAGAVGRGIGKGAAKVSAAKAQKTVGGELGKSQTAGTEFVFDDAGGFVTKRTESIIKVGEREFDIQVSAKEAFGVGGEKFALLPEGARPALRTVQEVTGAGAEPFTAGEGRFGFVVREKGKVVITGAGETGLAGKEVGGFDIFTRTAKGTVETAKGGMKEISALEVGALKEGLFAEIRGKGKGISEASGLVEGRSTTVGEGAPRTKGLVIEGASITSEGAATPAFLDPRSTKGTVLDIVGGEPRKVTRTTFLTRESVEPFQPKTPLPKKPTRSPLDIIDELVERQDTRPEFDVAKELKKQFTKKPVDLFESPKIGRVDVIERKLFPTAFKKSVQELAKTEDIVLTTAKKPSPREVTTPAPKVGVSFVDVGEAQKVKVVKKPSSVLKTSQAEKQIVGESIGEFVGETTKTPTIFGLVTTKEPLTREARVQAIKPFTEVSPTIRTVSKPIVETATKPTFSFVQVDKLASALELSTASRAATMQEQIAIQELAQPQKTAQTQRVAQIARLTQAQRATASLGGGGLPPTLTLTPTPVAAPSFSASTKKRGVGLFDVEVRHRGVFETVARVADLKKAAFLGQTSVEQSAAASFKVTGPKGLKRDVSRFLPSTFRKSKVSAGVFVQKRGARITSRGEKEDITAKGLFAISKKRRGLFA